MAKETIKEEAAERQEGKSMTGADLPRDGEGNLLHSLTDTHRPIPKSEGGVYDDTTKVGLPVEHQDLHGNTPWLEDPDLIMLRAIMEDYRTCQKARMKIENQKLAVDRKMDVITPEIEEMFETVLGDISRHELMFKKKAVKQLEHVKMPIVKILQGLSGIGPILVAEIITTIDIRKARYPSSLWAFTGYHTDYDKRYVPGVKGGGHKGFRSVMFNLGMCLIRAKHEIYWGQVYKRRKAKTSNSHKEVRHVHRLKGENGRNQVVKKLTAWKDVNPGRRHNDALRVMNKHFLADLWFVWRTIEGLPTADLYVKEHLGHESAIINPRERGWKF